MKKSTDVIEIYNKEYFLNQVDGCTSFLEFDGKFESLFPRYQRNVELLDLKHDHKLLEIGCGRGEICIFHAMRGGLAKGVDYSRDAIELAKLKASSLGLSVEFITSSFGNIKDEDDTYDRILASEFIEHISQEEGELFFNLAYSMLKADGKLFVYTMPNTLFRHYGYPIYRFLNLFRGIILPKVMADMTHEHYRLYHLNEQNYFSLLSLAKKSGFKKITVGYDARNEGESKLKQFLKYMIGKTPLRHILLTGLYLLAEK